MRNLKKILALVLALIMSLSLMATASATTFSDDDSINDTYRQAVEVLNGLEVLKGDDNGFRPEGDITRAEVAAILYRITTGDVTDERADNYTPYGQFSDVNAGSWYAGYVTYSANAGYIKGNGDGTFKPNNKVTGYEVLTMILRAVGYDKQANEFTGPDWQLHVASRAQEKGILANAQGINLGADATRQEVAELIFRAMLLPKVTYNAATLSYTDNSERVADVLGLERIEGVVVANHLADLDKTSITLKQGQTRLSTGEVLDVETGLEDIGESRWAYVQNGVHVLGVLEDAGNDVWEPENGLGDKVSNSAVRTNADTEYFKNFDPWTYINSDYRIRYEITYQAEGITEKAALESALKADAASKDWPWTVDEDGTGADKWEWNATSHTLTYSRVFPKETAIPDADMANIETIFSIADKKMDIVGVYTDGEVYVGTTSVKDISDEISYKEFYATYINEDVLDTYTNSDNGEWLKVVDNDGDGYAEYVFLTEYNLDQVTDSYTKSGDTVLEYNVLDEGSDDYEVIYEDEGIENGTVVLYTVIDGQARVRIADKVTATVKALSYKDVTVTTDDDTVYHQSEIENWTRLDEDIEMMDDGVAYNLYLDKYGHIRAYELAEGTQYALLTEAYSGNNDRDMIIKNYRGTVELTAGDEPTANYYVTNFDNSALGGYNPFFNADVVIYPNVSGSRGYSIANSATSGKDVLTPAKSCLNVTNYMDLPYFDWDARTGNANVWTSYTNVARYIKTGDDTVEIYSASKQATDKEGNLLYYVLNSSTDVTGDGSYDYKTTAAEWKKYVDGLDAADKGTLTGTAYKDLDPIMATDYVQLEATDLSAGQARYVIYGTSGQYVNAVHDTEYYLVYSGQAVAHFTDYSSLPALKALKTNGDTNIETIYAVAQNTNVDSNSTDYWVADVIVIELNESGYDSISLAYYNNRKTSARAGEVKWIDTLNNKYPDDVMELSPSIYGWNGQWQEFGFYALRGTEVDTANSSMTAGSLERIGWDAAEGDFYANTNHLEKSNYNEHGIYAGTIESINAVSTRGGYINLEGEATPLPTTAATRVWALRDGAYISAGNTRLVASTSDRSGNVLVPGNEGDRIIYVMDGTSVAFIVNVDEYAGTSSFVDELEDEWEAIMEEQGYVYVDETVAKITSITVKGHTVTPIGNTFNVTLTDKEARATSADADGYNISSVVTVPATLVNVTATTTQLNASGEEVASNVVIGSTSTTLVNASHKTGGTLTWYITVAGRNTGLKPVIYTVNVTILPQSTDSELTSIAVKGETATRTSGDGSSSNPYKYKVTVPYSSAIESSKIPQVLLGLPTEATVSVTTSGAGVTTYTAATAASTYTALNTSGGTFKFTVTAEAGGTYVTYYEVDVEIYGDVVTVKGDSNLKANPTSAVHYQLFNEAGIQIKAAGVNAYSDVDFKFSVVPFAASADTAGGVVKSVGYQIGTGEVVDITSSLKNGLYTIPQEALAAAEEANVDMIIVAVCKAGITFVVGSGKTAELNGVSIPAGAAGITLDADLFTGENAQQIEIKVSEGVSGPTATDSATAHTTAHTITVVANGESNKNAYIVTGAEEGCYITITY